MDAAQILSYLGLEPTDSSSRDFARAREGSTLYFLINCTALQAHKLDYLRQAKESIVAIHTFSPFGRLAITGIILLPPLTEVGSA